VLFFGMLKDVAGMSSEGLEIAEGSTLDSLFRHYAERFPRLADYSGSVVLALNQQFQPRETLVSDGDEVAFLPPVSGGSGYLHDISDPAGHFFALTRQPIDTQAIARRLLRGED
jgi:molybdopterin converting factor subunit 1